MSEVWKVIPGFSRYEASDQGRIRSNMCANGRPLGWVLSPAINGARYFHVRMVGDDGRLTSQRIHQLVALTFIGPKPPGDIQVRHLSGERLDNRLANLAYGTRSENMQDSVRHGTHSYGSRTHCGKGHEYTPENTYVRPNNGRTCRTCRRAYLREQRAAKRRERVSA